MTDTETNIEVDDKVVGSYFGVTSYEEFEIYTGPYGRDWESPVGPSFEWREDHPDEWKKQIWENTREQIRKELLGLCKPQYTKDGKVVSSVKKPITFRDWLSLGKQKAYKLPVDPSSKGVREMLIDTPGTFGIISRYRIVAPSEPHSGGIDGWCTQHKSIHLNKYTRLMYILLPWR
jgi:hypothetical protein